MKKVIFLFIFIFLLTGCTSYTELNDLCIVNTIGIDYKNHKFILTMNVISGELDDNTIEKDLVTYRSIGTTLDEAFHNIYLSSDKRLYLSHVDMLILSKDAINNNFLNILQNFLKNNEYRNNFNVVLLNDFSIDEFMDKKIQAEDIINILKTNQQESGTTILKDFETLMKELLIDKNTYLPTINYNDDKIILNGYTLIKDYSIFSELSIKESIILNLLTNNINKTYINGSNIIKNETVVTINKNNILFNIFTTIDNDDNFKTRMNNDIINFLEKYQKKDYDILKLLDKIRKNNHTYYKNNKDLLSKLSFNISIEVSKNNDFLHGGLIDDKR